MPLINHNMIVVARESRGWSQRDLAKAIGVTPSTMSRYEAGLVPLTIGDAARVAGALKYDCALLEETSPVYSLGASLIYHRKRARVPMGHQRRVQAEINVRVMQIRRLLKAADIGFEDRFPAIPPEEFNGNAERVARELKRIWSVPDGPIHHLTQIIEQHGGVVVQMDFGTNLIDGAHLRPPGLPPMFFVNVAVSGERYRYSLSHELGHAIMHHASPTGEVEKEANVFAAEWLMPRAKIRADLRNLTIERAMKLKKVWQVSAEAIIRRAFDLRIITKTKYRTLFQMLNSQGNRIEEPFPLPIETPGVFDSLVQFHVDRLGFSDDELRRLIFIDPQQFGPMDPESASQPRLRLTNESLFGEA